MMQSLVFPVVETPTNDQTKIIRFSLLLVFLIMISMFAGLYVTTPAFWQLERRGITIFGGMLLFIMTFTAIFFRINLNRLKGLQIALTPQGIERRSPKTVEGIAYADIGSVVIFEDKEGKVVTIQIKSAESTFLLHGFERMEQLATELVARLPDKTVVKRKPILFANYNPKIILLGGVIVGVIVLPVLLVLTVSLSGTLLFQVFVFGTQGIFLIAYKPLSRIYGKKWQLWETRLGIAMLVLMVLFVGAQLLGGGTAVLGISPCGWYGKYVQQSGCVNSFDNGEYVAFTPDSQNLIYDNFKHIIIAPIDGQKWTRTPYLSHDNFVLDFMLSQDGKTLVSATFSGQNEFWVWDVPTRALIQQGTFPVSTDNLALSPDGQTIAISSWNIELWDTVTWQNDLAIQGGGAIAFSPDGSLLAGRWEDALVLWDTQDGHEVQSFNISDGYSHLVNLAFSPDGTQLAAGEFLTGKIAVWEVTNGRLLYDWREDAGWEVEGLAFATNGRLLAASYSNSLTGENHIKFWSLTDGSLVKQIELSTGSLYQAESLAFSPDGRWFAAGSSQEAMVFDMSQIMR